MAILDVLDINQPSQDVQKLRLFYRCDAPDGLAAPLTYYERDLLFINRYKYK